MSKPDITAVCAFLMIAAGGIVHGLTTHRWIPNLAVNEAVQRLSTIPAQMGNWESVDLQLSDTELTIGGIAGYTKREYTHSQTGGTVTMLLVAGDSGPISLHSPTVCFSGRGFRVFGQPQSFVTQSTAEAGHVTQHEFQSADFANPAVSDPSMIRVYWGWSIDGQWQSPEQPRMTFAGQPSLYKLYVSERWIPDLDQQSDTSNCKLFLQDALPEITRALNHHLGGGSGENSHDI